jgi:hypothetical protein
VNYVDEINGGKQEAVNGGVRVRFTKDNEAVEKSARADVVAQKELLVTAVDKDAALADADAGKYQDAAQKLSNRSTVLNQAAQNASPEVKAQIQLELDNLQRHSGELQNGQYDASTRKSLQSESWSYRNGKAQ